MALLVGQKQGLFNKLLISFLIHQLLPDLINHLLLIKWLSVKPLPSFLHYEINSDDLLTLHRLDIHLLGSRELLCSCRLLGRRARCCEGGWAGRGSWRAGGRACRWIVCGRRRLSFLRRLLYHRYWFGFVLFKLVFGCKFFPVICKCK